MKKSNQTLQICTKDNLNNLLIAQESGDWRIDIKRVYKGQKLEILGMRSHNGLPRGSFILGEVTGYRMVVVNGKRRYVLLFNALEIYPSYNPRLKFLRYPIHYKN